MRKEAYMVSIEVVSTALGKRAVTSALKSVEFLVWVEKIAHQQSVKNSPVWSVVHQKTLKCEAWATMVEHKKVSLTYPNHRWLCSLVVISPSIPNYLSVSTKKALGPN
jgi:hypothetical protein